MSFAATHLVGFGVGGGGGFGAPTTAFARTLNAAGSGWENYSVRLLPDALSAGGAQIRVTFQATAATTFTADRASIGIVAGSGNVWDTAAVPVELLFSGVGGFSVASGGEITSDWADLTTSVSSEVVVIIDIASSNGNPRRDTATGTKNSTYIKSASDTYNQAAPAGFSLEGNEDIMGFNLIEVRAAL
jgi:hypothetical protein